MSQFFPPGLRNVASSLTLEETQTFTRNKNRQKEGGKKTKQAKPILSYNTCPPILTKTAATRNKMPRRDSIFSPTAIKPHTADKTTHTHTQQYLWPFFFLLPQSRKKSEKEAAALCRRIEAGQFAFPFTSDCIDQFQWTTFCYPPCNRQINWLGIGVKTAKSRRPQIGREKDKRNEREDVEKRKIINLEANLAKEETLGKVVFPFHRCVLR